jgi:heat shock protein HslJ
MRTKTLFPLCLAFALTAAACAGSSTPGPSAAVPTSAPSSTAAPHSAPPATAAPPTSVPPADGSTSAPSGTTGADLEGRTFVSRAIVGRDLVAGTQVSLAFDGGTLQVTAGCNTIGGHYAVGDGRLRLSDVGSTAMGCASAQADQDAWLTRFLDGATVSMVGETLTLASGGVILTLGVAPTDGSTPAPGGTATDLVGGTFVSTAIVGRQLVADTRVTVSFSDGMLVAQAGCNTMSGPYTVTGGRLLVDQMATTEMACPAAQSEQDAWLAAFLDGASVALDGGTLTLAAGDVTLTLSQLEHPGAALPLENTNWVLDSILVGGDAVTSVPPGVTASITIAGGRISVHAGCNTGGGAVQVAGGTLAFGPMAVTKMACKADAMTVEQAVLGALSGTATYTLDANTLTIQGPNGGLIFKPAP